MDSALGRGLMCSLLLRPPKSEASLPYWFIRHMADLALELPGLLRGLTMASFGAVMEKMTPTRHGEAVSDARDEDSEPQFRTSGTRSKSFKVGQHVVHKKLGAGVVTEKTRMRRRWQASLHQLRRDPSWSSEQTVPTGSQDLSVRPQASVPGPAPLRHHYCRGGRTATDLSAPTPIASPRPSARPAGARLLL